MLDRLGVEVVFTWKAVVLAMAVMSFPLTVRGAFEQLDRRYEQMAATLGAGPVRVFLTISVPMVANSVAAGAILGFARAVGEFAATIFSSSTSVDLKPRERQVGYVPQDALLFPHLRVRANLTYGARPASRGDLERRTHLVDLARVAEMLEITSLLDRRVQALSGGERQRVALGRALMTQPELLLLDEPLAGVDRARRERIVPYLLRIKVSCTCHWSM